MAVLAFNVLSAIRVAIERQHRIKAHEPAGISLYYVANEIRATYKSMMIAIPGKAWQHYQRLTDDELSREFLQIATGVEPAKLRKHPRGPKKEVKKGYVSGQAARRHVSTARILASGKPA